MKKIILRNAILMFSLGVFSATAYAQKIEMPASSPLQTMTQKFGLGEVTIEYSRPVAKGRTIFGDVVPYNKVWRTGANATTKITFTDVVKVEGKEVKAGTYGLYTIPHSDGSCEVMLYSDLKLGGNVKEYSEKNEVLRVKVKAAKMPIKIESFTILLDNVQASSANLILAWENTSIAVKLTTDVDTRVMESIDANIKSKTPEYFRAASYYFENGKDLSKASDWAGKAVAQNPKAYYMMLLKAKIEYALGNNSAGKATAEQTIKLADEAGNDDYVRMAKELIEKNK